MSVNKAIILGSLGGNPEIKTTQQGSKIGNFSIATSETWKDKNTGERREKTEWHRKKNKRQSGTTLLFLAL